ncbi:hypothetical protein ACI2KR_31020 [Pseudomonas luteola]
MTRKLKQKDEIMRQFACFTLLCFSLTAQADVYRYYYTTGVTVPSASAASADPLYGEWEKAGDPLHCTNWSPSEGTVAKGKTFTQVATDCEQAFKRSVQPRTKDSSGNIVNSGNSFYETMTGPTSVERTVQGTLETWVDYEPSFSQWTNVQHPYDCSDWSPVASSVTTAQTFDQTSNTCKQDQIRSRQNREQEQSTQAIRDVGEPTTEKQTLTNQKMTRSYTVSISPWQSEGTYYDCSNWSPDPSTVNAGTAFTQTATNCKLDQRRTRNESYQDPVTTQAVDVSSTSETQTLSNQTTTRQATGTNENLGCRYSMTQPYSNWSYRTDDDHQEIYFNGQFYRIPTAITKTTIDGYVYTRSSLKQTTKLGGTAAIYFYEVCKSKADS